MKEGRKPEHLEKNPDGELQKNVFRETAWRQEGECVALSECYDDILSGNWKLGVKT